MWHDQIIAGILNSKALYEYKTNRMSCKHTRDRNQDTYKKVNCSDKNNIERPPYVTINSVKMINLHAMLTKYT